jgi:hypothetical protein
MSKQDIIGFSIVGTWVVVVVLVQIVLSFISGAQEELHGPDHEIKIGRVGLEAWRTLTFIWPVALVALLVFTPFYLASRLGKGAARRRREKWLARQPKGDGSPYRSGGAL